jgi:multiple sugar transport system substrate-binding protein
MFPPRARALAAAGIAAFAVAAAAACGGGGGGGEDEIGEADPTAQQTLRISGFGTGDEIATIRAEAATEALAPARVRNPQGAFDIQRFLATLASGDVPDVIYLDRQLVGTLAARGALTPLDSCLETQDVDRSLYREGALEEVTFEGELYAVPEFTNQRTILINEDVARDAGVDPEQISTTDWEQLREVNRRLLQRSGNRVTRIGFDPKIPEFFAMWARANGTRLLSEDGLEANLDDPKVVEALEYTVSLIEDHGGWGPFKAFRDTWDFFGAGNQIAENQLGAFPIESFYYNVLSEVSPDAGIRAVPFTTREGDPITLLSGNGWAIPRGARNPELACLWMTTMTSTETWLRAARGRAEADRESGQAFTGLYTANSEADRRIFEEVYEPVDPSFDAIVELLVDVQDDGFALPASPAGAEFRRAVEDAVNRVLAGQATAEEALRRAQEDAQTAIDEAER